MQSRLLRSLLGHHAGAFANSRWPTEPLVAHGPVSRLPTELATGVLSSFEAVCDSYHGRVVAMRNIGSYQRSFAGDAASARDYFLAGMTVIFEDVTVPSIVPWKERLEREIGIPAGICRMAGFASPKGPKSGLRPHWDQKDGLLIQLQGRKVIRLARNRDGYLPSVSHVPGARASEELAIEVRGRIPEAPILREAVELRSGSVIYLPRGYWHATQAIDDSFAVAVDFAWPTIADVLLQRLRIHLLRDPRWREPPYGAWRNQESFVQASDQLSQLLRGLPEAISDLTSDEVLAGVDDLDTRFRFVGPRTSFAVQNVSFVFKRIDVHAYELHLTRTYDLEATTIHVERKYVAACKWILTRRSRFTIAETAAAFPSLNNASVRRMLKALVTVDAIQFAGRV